jgi:hypothetical protein
MGRVAIWLSGLSLLVTVTAACTGAGGATWHRSVTPDTRHADVAGFTRFEQRRGDRTSTDLATSLVQQELRRELTGIDCRTAPLRSTIHGMASPDPESGGELTDSLPLAFFACGRSAVVRALNSFDTLKGRDEAWTDLVKYGATSS